RGPPARAAPDPSARRSAGRPRRRGRSAGASGRARRRAASAAALRRLAQLDPRPLQAAVVIGGILTAMVTPFAADGWVNEPKAVELMHHLLETGSDGLVVAGSTG